MHETGCRGAAAALLLFLAAGPASGQAPAGSPPAAEVADELARRPRIGLVLSGGGARGASHVGVLKVLEELRIPVDAIAGTSMGSIVGGLYASGMSPAELEAALTGVDWNRALTDRSNRDLLAFRRKQDDLTLAAKIRVGLRGWKPTLPLGLIQGQKLELLLRSFTLPVAGVEDFDQLVYPFRAVAADLATTRAVVLAKGDLVKAMRASMSVPAIFEPVKVEGGLLIDGGVADNLPVDVVRTMGVDLVIAVDIGAHLYKLDEITSAYAVNDQMLTGLMRRETERQMASLGPDDTGIVPDLGSYGSADFAKAAQIIPLGEVAARAAADRLRRYSLSEAAWQAYRAGLKRFDRGIPTIASVTVTQDAKLSNETVAKLMSVEPGQPLDTARLEDDLQRVYGLDLYEKVGYRLVPAGPGRVDLRIDGQSRGWGPDYVQFGLALRDNLQNNTSFDLNFRINRLAVSATGAEWRTDLRLGENQQLKTEWYQPFRSPHGFFWAARFEARQQPFGLLVPGGNDTAVFRLGAVGATVDLGRSFSNWGEARLGVERATGHFTPVAGNDLHGIDYDEGRVYLAFGTDTYDDAAFPRRGMISASEVSYSSEALGATDDVGRASVAANWIGSVGRNTFGFGLQGGAFFDDTKAALPYGLGGFGRLSGLGESRIVGRYVALGRLLYYRQLAKVSLSAIEMPIYFGGTLEAGNAWLTEDQVDAGDLLLHGSLFFGIDSPLGPIYFGGGLGQNDESAMFFYLGRTF